MAVLPVMLGRPSDTDPTQFVRFSTFNTQCFPSTPSPSGGGDVRRTMDRLFKYNALKLMSLEPTAADIEEIINVMERTAWGDGKDSLKARVT